MRTFNDLLSGLAAGGLSILLVFGALSLSLVEGAPVNSIAGQGNTNPTASNPQAISTATPILSLPRIIPTLPPAPTTCPPPAGWQAYTLTGGDTLSTLSETYRIAAQDIKKLNCLVSDNLLPGTAIYLPLLAPTPTQNIVQPNTATLAFFPTLTRSSCGPPPGWVRYIVQSNDTLFSIGLTYGVGVGQLQDANCLGNSTLIYAGQSIHVPNVPPRLTPTRTPTVSATQQPTAVPPTLTPDLAATSAAETAAAQQDLTLTDEANNNATSQAQTATAQSLQSTTQAQTASAEAFSQTSIAQTATAQAGNP